MLIDGGRFDATALASDGVYIDHPSQGALVIQAALFEGAPTSNFSIRVGADAPSGSGHVVAIGCTFPTKTPFVQRATYSQRRIVLGCNATSSTGAIAIDDQFYGVGANGSPTEPSTERLRIGNAFLTNNTSGTVTISGASTEAIVSFTAREVDDAYKVIVGIDSIAGPANPGAPFAADKSNTGFKVKVPFPPGSGNSVTICWLLIRNS